MKKGTSKKQYLFLFADLCNSMDVANLGSDEEYSKYLGSFHWAVNRAKYYIQSNHVFPQAHFRRIIQNIVIEGDEVYSNSIIDNASEFEKQDVVASSVAFLYILQLYWLASPFNYERMKSNKPLMKISAGLHMGDGHYVPAEYSNVLASVHIDIAKRIETSAKVADISNIFATYSVKKYFEQWRLQIIKEIEPKYRPPLAYTSFGEAFTCEIDSSVGKLKIHELDLDLIHRKDEIYTLLDEMTTIKDNFDFQAETASMIMATNFLICKGNPFRYNDGRNAIHGLKFKNATNYIDLWFDSYSRCTLNHINNSFMALNYSFISSALLRHPELTKTKVKKYSKICQKNYQFLKTRFLN